MPLNPIGLPRPPEIETGEQTSGLGGGLGTGTALGRLSVPTVATGGGEGKGLAATAALQAIPTSGVGGGLGTGVAAVDVISTGQPNDRDDDGTWTNWQLCDGSTVRAARMSFYWTADSAFRADMGPPIRTAPEDHDRQRARFELAGRFDVRGRIIDLLFHTGRAGDAFGTWQMLIRHDPEPEEGAPTGQPSA